MDRKEIALILVMIGALGAGVFLLSRESPSQGPPESVRRRAQKIHESISKSPGATPARQDQEQTQAKAGGPEEIKPDPRFVVAPVDTEPVEPEDDEVKDSKGIQILPHGGRAHFESRKVVIPGMILMQGGLIELFACAEGGKEHESVVRLHTSPWQLNFGILVGCKFKKGPVPKTLSIHDKDQGDRALIFLQWKDDKGKAVTHRAEDLVIDRRRDALMPRVGWTFIGSEFEPELDANTGLPTGRHRFVAEQVRSIITTFRDPGTFFDTPLPEGMNDTFFEANTSLLPPPGTPVKIIIRPPSEAERTAIERAESEAVVWAQAVDVLEKQARIEEITLQRIPEMDRELKGFEPKTEEEKQRLEALQSIRADLDKELAALRKELPEDRKRSVELQEAFEKKYGAKAVLPRVEEKK